jgi:hypothetical protein
MAVAALILLSAAGCPTDSTDDSQDDFTTPGVIHIEEGDGQVTAVDTPFPHPLRVIVFTPADRKCNGCQVTWAIPGHDDPLKTKTDVFGESAIQLTPHGLTGQFQIVASLDNGESATFHVTVQ